MEILMQAHAYQREKCIGAPQPILNAACKEDPAHIGSTFGAVNLDICDHDEQTRRDLKTLPNFVQGSVLDMSKLYLDKHFGTVVLGEFLEHCKPRAALQAMKECRRVLKDDGILILTFPLDDRPPERQHAKHLLKVWVDGEEGADITVAHQTVWEPEMFAKLLEDSGGWVSEDCRPLVYGFVPRKPGGWGHVLKKRLSA